MLPFRPGPPRARYLRPSARQRAVAQWRGWDWREAEKAAVSAARPAGDVMPRILRDLRIDQRMSETEILKVWNHLLDPNVTAHAQPVGLRKGTLFVKVDSSVWLDEIVRYRRREILERLQNSFGRDLVVRISFRLG